MRNLIKLIITVYFLISSSQLWANVSCKHVLSEAKNPLSKASTSDKSAAKFAVKNEESGVSYQRNQDSGLASGRFVRPIAENEQIKAALSRNPESGARSALRIAEKMSFEQARIISEQGGIHIIEANEGCPHCCLGCLTKTGSHQFKKQTWKEFTNRIDGLLTLEKVISQETHENIQLLNRDFFMTFNQSDPMAAIFPDGDGFKTIRDMMKYLHEKTNTPSLLVTSGWNPRFEVLQKAAESIAEDVATGKAPYLIGQGPEKIYFQIKVPSLALRTHIERKMKDFLAQDSVFMSQYGQYFNEHGFNFSKYPDPREAWLYYSSVANKNFESILRASSYFNDRIDNLATLLPAGKDTELRLNLYYSDGEDFDQVYLYPFMSKMDHLEKLVLTMLREKGITQSPKKINHIPWSFNSRKRSYDLGAPGLTVNGTVHFSGASPGYFSNTPPDLARHPDLHLRSFVDNPILAVHQGTPDRLLAFKRMRPGQATPLTENVYESVFNRVTQWLEESGYMPTVQEIKLSKEVKFLSDSKGQTDPIIEIQVDGQLYQYHFNDDGIYLPTQPSNRAGKAPI